MRGETRKTREKPQAYPPRCAQEFFREACRCRSPHIVNRRRGYFWNHHL